jgi:hypothetical protein
MHDRPPSNKESDAEKTRLSRLVISMVGLLLVLICLVQAWLMAKDATDGSIRGGVNCGKHHKVADVTSEALLPSDTHHRDVRWLFLQTLHKNLDTIAAADGNRMGHTGDFSEQTIKLFDILGKLVPAAGTVCEIGFNVGHSAATFLIATSAKSLIAFDCGGKASVHEGFTSLQESLPYAKFEMVEGNSPVMVNKFAQKNGADATCDVIHIDGAHDGPFPAADWEAMWHYARDDGQTLVVFDDCNCDTEWCIAPLQVFQTAVARGEIAQLPEAASMLQVNGRPGTPEFREKGSCIGWITSRSQKKIEVPTFLIDPRNGNRLETNEKC